MASFALMISVLAYGPTSVLGHPEELDADTFFTTVMDPNRDVFVKFYAPWCGHCQRFAPQWESLEQLVRSDSRPAVAEVAIVSLDATKYRTIADQHGVQSYPTIKFYAKRDKQGQRYTGSRNPSDMLSYLGKSVSTR